MRAPLAAALRETEEEIGLSREHVTFAGYLEPHLVLTGFWVTPVVGVRAAGVRAAARLPRSRVDVRGAAAAHSRCRRITSRASACWARPKVLVYDIPYGEHHIWGATAGMLMSLYRLLQRVTMAAIDRLLHIMARLRDPQRGCPWDLEQTFATIAPYTIEEAYEVADAIEREDSCRAAR